MPPSIKRDYVRPAIVLGYDSTNHIAKIRYTDVGEDRIHNCPAPHPFAMPGGGILIGPVIGTRVLVSTGHMGRPFIVGTIPQRQYSLDLSSPGNTEDLLADEPAYTNIRSGDIAIQSVSGSTLKFEREGNVCFRFGDSEIAYTDSDILSEKIDHRYTISEAHRQISGVIKRDLRNVQNPLETITDKLSNPDFDRALSDIGRNPNFTVSRLTTGVGLPTERRRNPALVENRTLTYEFANSYQTDVFDEEIKRLTGTVEPDEELSFLFQPNRRDQVRTDILNLGIHNPNALVEKVEGTVVDRYGKILDLNRKIIDYTQIPKDDYNRRLDLETSFLRRSIKYHFEINTKKETKSIPARDALIENAKDHSRWSIDVDGEGLTKINIPSSTDTGNIPLLTRYVPTLDFENIDKLNDESFRDSQRKDIRHIGFGDVEGEPIGIPEDYAPENLIKDGDTPAPIKYRTAFHSIVDTAAEVKFVADAFASFGPLLSDIDNTIGPDGSPNAGGRSVHANLDGSLEMNVGRDNVDGKSIVLDTAGGIIQRVGRDFNDFSLISQVDGNIAIQVGGDSIEGEEVVETNVFELFVKTSGGFHQITFDERGIMFKSAPNTDIILNSSKNLILNAAGETFIGGESIRYHGKFDETTLVFAPEQLLTRYGTENK